MIESPFALESSRTQSLSLRSLLYLPTNYAMHPADRYPLILFLHGSGERGDNLEQVKAYGLPTKLQHWADCPFVVVAPQCPAGSVWVYQLDALALLLESVISRYPIKTDQVYLTGLSMGGTGTWYMAGAFPSRFAAIAPICGHNTGTSHCELFKDVPAWIFHGAKDTRTPVIEAQFMESALKSLGAEVRLTVYPEADHNSWTQAYDDPELYTWFLQHRRKEAET